MALTATATQVPWHAPGAAEANKCCCGSAIECEHTANFLDPRKWDPLTDGGFPTTSQIELTSAQYVLLTAGGYITFEASATASAAGNKLIPPGPDYLTLHGEFSWSMTKKVEATFLQNSCKQKGLEWTETVLTTNCSSSGSSSGGANPEWYPYYAANYPCVPYAKTMALRFSFYNRDGGTVGKLYDYGMYFNLRVYFRILRTLLFGEEGYDFFDGPTLGPIWAIENNSQSPDGNIAMQTDAGSILLPYKKSLSADASSFGSAAIHFFAAAP